MDCLILIQKKMPAASSAKHEKNMNNRSSCIVVHGEAIGNIGFVRGTDVERFNAEVGLLDQ